MKYTNDQMENKLISCLMRDIGLLDRYRLNESDFASKKCKDLYNCIVDMRNDGYTTITKQVTYGYALDKEIGDYIKKYDRAWSMTEHDISDILNLMLDDGEMTNYPAYYNEVKKLSCLRQLKKSGYDMTYYDDEDSDGQKHIEQDSIDTIIARYKDKLTNIESIYKSRHGLMFVKPDDLPGANVPDEWLIDNVIKVGTFNELIAPAKAGKSQLAYQIAFEVQNGKKVLDMFDCKQCDVGYVDYEMRNNAIARRFQMLREFEGLDNYKDVGVIGMSTHYDVELSDVIDAIIREHEYNNNLKLIVIDNYYSLVNTECDTNAMGDTKAILDQIKRSLTPLGITVILVNHTNKSVALEGDNKKDISFNNIVNSAFGSMSHGALLDTAIYIERLADGRRIHIAGRDCNEPIRISCRFDRDTNYFFSPLGDDMINRLSDDDKSKIDALIGDKDTVSLTYLRKHYIGALTPEMLRAAGYRVYKDGSNLKVASC